MKIGDKVIVKKIIESYKIPVGTVGIIHRIFWEAGKVQLWIDFPEIDANHYRFTIDYVEVCPIAK